MITSSMKAQALFSECKKADVEEFWVVSLNTKLQVIEKKMLFRGTLHSCIFHPRDLFRFVVTTNAFSFIVAHNHPSGDCRPSQEDLRITKRIKALAEMIEIRMNDHLILSRNSYYSFSDQNQKQIK